MTNEQIAIWKYLKENALGLNNAKHISEIASAFGVPAFGTNNDNVRNWIKELVIKFKKPIGTSKKGAFVILNDIEKEKAAKFVERNNRANAVRNNGIYQE